MNKWNVAAKIAGGVVAGAVLYNAHNTGRKTSAEQVKEGAGDRLTDIYMRSRRIDERS